MIRIKPKGLLCFFVLFLLVCYVSVFAAERIPFISGIVKDNMGRILPGVDILISPDNFNNIVLHAKTNHEGRFLLKDVTPGSYKIAAAKKGYQTDIQKINVQEEKSSDITLKPLANTLDADWKKKFPNRLDWIRRLPRKDILKELEASVLNLEDEDKTAVNAPQSIPDQPYALKESYSLPFEVELRQIISREFGSDESLLASDKTNRTKFSLAGNLGDDGRFRVEALQNKWKESFLDEIETDLLERKSESLGVAGQYDFGDAGRLGFSTFYERDRLDVWNDSYSDALASHGIQKGWGYSASWEREFDDDMFLDLNLTHTGSEFKGDSFLAKIQDSFDELMAVSNQIINAAGSFQANLFEGHRIDVGLKTHYHDYSSELTRALPFYSKDLYYFTGPKEGGYHISLYGKDSWMVLHAVTISYGLQYYHIFHSDGIQIVSPVFEIEYRGKSGSSIKAEFSYAIDSSPSDGRLSNTILGRDPSLSGAEKNLSCRAEVEKKFGEGASLKANIAYIPLLMLNADRESLEMVLGDSFLYMTNGSASSLSGGTFFEKKFNSVSGGIGLNYGIVEGTFSSLLPEDLPIQIFHQGDLDYLLAILKATAHKTKTELFMQLRKVRDQSSLQNLSDNPVVEYSLISVRFSQGVPVFHSKGVHLKAILEYDDTLALNELADNIERSLLPYRRVSGGFQITF